MTSITLFHPIIVNGELRSTIDIESPSVQGIRETEKYSVEGFAREVTQLAKLCSLSPQNLIEMDMRDYGKIKSALQGFFA